MKTGSFFMAGFSGLTVPSVLEKLILEEDLGGVILFSRNMQSPDQVKKLCERLHDLKSQVSSMPLLIAIDQEGGFVVRFSNGIKPMPSSLAQKRGGSPDWTEELYNLTGSSLQGLGINCNFAPVLDVAPEEEPSIIGIRSFSSDPLEVASYASSAVKGTHTAGILACGKHYPGLGRALLDPHLQLPVISASKDDLISTDFVPYQQLISRDLPLIMTSHASYPSLDTENIPASFSSKINTDLLRDELEFKGVLIGDDLEMGAIASTWTLEKSAVRMLISGVDMVMICHSLDKIFSVIKFVETALHDGVIGQNKMEESRVRMESIAQFLKKINRSQTIDSSDERMDFLCKEIASRSLAVLKQNDPFSFSGRISTAVVIYSKWVSMQVEEKESFTKPFLDLLKVHFKNMTVFINPDGKDFLCYDEFGQLILITSDLAHDSIQQKWLQDLKKHRRQIDLAVCIKNPSDAKLLAPHCRNIIATFGFHLHNQQTLLANLNFHEK
ncbi:MAG: beta-N-acetylhexosaminidase [Candidatus Aureabacteria bacterium]|nr:beta-N-acetylhexosaminidase [Candidatus Auribacterota bacterium]